MPDPDDAFIARLVASAGASPETLAAATARCWPGGGDRDVPAARRWLRGWSPRPLLVPPPRCSCASGRCALCG